MQIKTKGLVIGQVKYTGSKVILHIFTRELGWLSFITHIGGKTRPRALCQVCTLVDLDFDYRENAELHQIRQIQLSDVSVLRKDNILKSAVEMFIAEMLYRTLHRNYINQELFDHMYSLLLDLEEAEQVAMFPIRSSLTLCTDLGFEIPLPENPEYLRFDPVEGYFNGQAVHMTDEERAMGRALITAIDSFNRGDLEHIPQSSIRKQILETLITYLKERLELKANIRSHEVLEVIFHS